MRSRPHERVAVLGPSVDECTECHAIHPSDGDVVASRSSAVDRAWLS